MLYLRSELQHRNESLSIESKSYRCENLENDSFCTEERQVRLIEQNKINIQNFIVELFIVQELNIRLCKALNRAARCGDDVSQCNNEIPEPKPGF